MSKDFDEDNDVSRVFARNANRAFQRDFAAFLPPKRHTSESKTKTNELNVKLIEAQEKIDALNRSLENKNREIEKLHAADTDSQNKIGELREDVSQLKTELNKLKCQTQHAEEGKLANRILMEDLRTALSKFRTWYSYAEKQMEVMKSILQDADKWNETNRYKIYFSYKDVQPLSITDDEVASLCKVSVLEYPGIEEIEGLTNSETHSNIHSETKNICFTTSAEEKANHCIADTSTQTDQLESGFIQVEEDFSRPSSQAYPASQSQLDVSFHEDQWRFLEMQERIQKLESENAKLKDERVILKQRQRESVLLEEQKVDAENRVNILRQQNLAIIADHEKLKDVIRTKLFRDLERHNANEIIQKISDACSKNEELEKKLNELETTPKATRDSDAASPEELKRVAQFFKQKYQAEIDDLQKRLSKLQQPSDTTCVYRFQSNNPLDAAYEEYLVNQAASCSGNGAKRRKMDSDNSELGSSEEVRDMRIKIEQQERSLKMHKESASKYRQVISILTGYHVKMREEGLYEVQSVFGRGGTFCFKQREDSGMDLLDGECARQWSKHVTNYLAKYDSIPAFLAAVVLSLIESDATILSTSMLDYTKDTQQVL